MIIKNLCGWSGFFLVTFGGVLCVFMTSELAIV